MQRLGQDGDGSIRLLAGGTGLLTLMKADIVTPRQLIDIKRADGLAGGIAETSGGLRLGALTTLAEIETHPVIAERYPALAEAAALSATPRLRPGDDCWQSTAAPPLLVLPQQLLPLLAQGRRHVPCPQRREPRTRARFRQPLRRRLSLRPRYGARGPRRLGPPPRCFRRNAYQASGIDGNGDRSPGGRRAASCAVGAWTTDTRCRQLRDQRTATGEPIPGSPFGYPQWFGKRHRRRCAGQ
ncbi:FAD binding domain-containing protein [Nitrolancea hollandica]